MNFADNGAFDENTDIIYGIGEWISRYIIYQQSGGKTKYAASDKIPEDVWNKAQTFKDTHFFAINTFNQPITAATYALNNGMLNSTANAGAFIQKTQDYFTALNKSIVYGSQSTFGSPSDKAFSDKLGKSNAKLDTTNQKEVSAAAKDLAIRRSSKFGIQYVVENLKGTVHYVLDTVDMSVVLEKKTLTNGSDYTKIPIVTSELRYLFRNGNRFAGTKRVIFWRDYKDTVPPWKMSQYEADWALYAVDRIIKYIAKLTGDKTWAENVQASFAVPAKVKDPKEAFKRLKLNLNKLKEDGKAKQNALKWLSQLPEANTAGDVIRYFHSIPANLINRDDAVLAQDPDSLKGPEGKASVD